MSRDAETINSGPMRDTGIKEIVDWLIDGARSAPQPHQVLAQLSERLVACGIPLWRVAVFVRTLHPQVMGRRLVWRPGAEVEISEAPYELLETATYRESPITRVYQTGQAIRRKEDPRLIMGRARYIDDINVTGQLWAAFVRSPEAHAKIVSIDTSAAEAHDEVLLVLTAADLEGHVHAPLPMAWVPPGVEMNTPEHWPLAKDVVKHVGEGEQVIALVLQGDAHRADAAWIFRLALVKFIDNKVVQLAAGRQIGPRQRQDVTLQPPGKRTKIVRLLMQARLA